MNWGKIAQGWIGLVLLGGGTMIAPPSAEDVPSGGATIPITAAGGASMAMIGGALLLDAFGVKLW